MRKFNCVLCTDTFGTQKELNGHVKVHTQDLSLLADIAGTNMTVQTGVLRVKNPMQDMTMNVDFATNVFNF